MKKIFLFLFIFLSVSYCKKEPDKVLNEKQFLFTDSLTGTSLYENPEITSPVIDTIPHASKVEVIPENPAYTIQREATIKWRKVNYNSREGWVIATFLSAKVEKHYFSVVTTSGLPLREKADVKSKVISNIPFGYIGEFYNQSKENVVIEKQPGFDSVLSTVSDGVTSV